MLNVAINNPAVEKMVLELLSRGEYQSAEEIVSAAVTAFNQEIQEQLSPQEYSELQAKIAVGIEQADRGEFARFSAEDVIRDGLASRKQHGSA